MPPWKVHWHKHVGLGAVHQAGQLREPKAGRPDPVLVSATASSQRDETGPLARTSVLAGEPFVVYGRCHRGRRLLVLEHDDLDTGVHGGE